MSAPTIAVDLRLEPRWVIPIEPGGAREDHVLLIDEGRIAALLPRDEADARYTARETVALPQHALLPGLVNAHTHAAMSLFRGIADDVPLQTWLEQHIWPRE